MKKGQIKYYFLLIASIAGISYFVISYADQTISSTAAGLTSPTGAATSTPAGATSDAYKFLEDAQTDAQLYLQTADKTAEDLSKNQNPSQLDYLKKIADSAYAFLKAFNQFSLNWLQIYTVPTSTDLNSLFGNVLISSEGNLPYQLALLKGGSFNTLDPKTGEPSNPAVEVTVNSIYPIKNENIGIFELDVPSADINYGTLVNNLTMKVMDKDKKVYPLDITNASYFVKNASGINIFHPALRSPKIDSEGYKQYLTFINSIKSIASYNAYILNAQLGDMQNGFKLNQAQTELKKKASNPTWLNHVNNELSIGVILRQILLFNSQTFVVMSDLLTTQKQLLAATAMTNTLLIANTGALEKDLRKAAT